MNYNSLAKALADSGIANSTDTRLAPYTTFRIGGAAKIAVFPKNPGEAVTALGLIRDSGARCLVLGNGSNVLVSDSGFDGAAVILSGMRNYSLDGEKITAAAGLSITRLSSIAAENSLSGLEFAYGIPGTVGGGVFMNAGAYGGEIGSVVLLSEWYDLKTGRTGEYEGAEQGFSYRHSVYMDEEKIILSAVFGLEKGDRAGITSRMEDYMARRREKQPLEYPSAGSVFKRGNGFITAQVIDEVGLKGRSVGGAMVSEKHAGFIINTGGATSDDVLRLIEIIKREVFEKTGHTIECEVRYID